MCALAGFIGQVRQCAVLQIVGDAAGCGKVCPGLGGVVGLLVAHDSPPHIVFVIMCGGRRIMWLKRTVITFD
jgi:hypothetical protein